MDPSFAFPGQLIGIFLYAARFSQFLRKGEMRRDFFWHHFTSSSSLGRAINHHARRVLHTGEMEVRVLPHAAIRLLEPVQAIIGVIVAERLLVARSGVIRRGVIGIIVVGVLFLEDRRPTATVKPHHGAECFLPGQMSSGLPGVLYGCFVGSSLWNSRCVLWLKERGLSFGQRRHSGAEWCLSARE